jgi:hypothetical protein
MSASANDDLNRGTATLSEGLQNSADQVALLSRDLMNIEQNVNESISLILNTVQSDSEFRRKMVESFKQMSTLARQCKEGRGNLDRGDAIANEEKKFDSINSNQSERERELVQIIDNLKIQLTTANEQIKQLQNGIREAEKTRLTLKSENRELGDMNFGYRVEIEKQMSIFERLNQLLQTVRAKVSKFLQTSDNVQHNINTYVADGILAEIRQDVLKSPQFSYIEQDQGGGGDNPVNSKEPDLIKRVQDDVQTKWIQQLTSLIADLETVISNMTSIGDGSSISTWLDYKTRLMEFLHLWAEKSAKIIQSWISTRQKRSRKS